MMNQASLPPSGATNSIPTHPAFPVLEEAAKPDVYLQLTFWEEYGALVLICAFVLIALVTYFVFFFGKNKKQIIYTPAQICIQKIHALQTDKLSLKDAAVNFSLVLREYITGKTEDPTLYETQEEFNRRVNSLNALPNALHEPVRDLLDEMARLKYEPYTENNDEKVNALAERTVNLINDIEQYQEKEIKETDIVNKG